jgi:hypothetical protein
LTRRQLLSNEFHKKNCGCLVTFLACHERNTKNGVWQYLVDFWTVLIAM